MNSTAEVEHSWANRNGMGLKMFVLEYAEGKKM